MINDTYYAPGTLTLGYRQNAKRKDSPHRPEFGRARHVSKRPEHPINAPRGSHSSGTKVGGLGPWRCIKFIRIAE